MTAAYIRRYYQVPAKRGGRVIVNGQPGVITGFEGQYIKVRLDRGGTFTAHPTWRIEYVTVDWASKDEIADLRETTRSHD